MADRGRDSAELISYLAKALVSEPNEVEVIVEEDGELIELETEDEDRRLLYVALTRAKARTLSAS